MEIIEEIAGMLKRVESEVRDIVDFGSPIAMWSNDSCPSISNSREIDEHHKDSTRLEYEFAYLKYKAELAQRTSFSDEMGPELLLENLRILMINDCAPLRGKYFRNIEAKKARTG